MLTLKRCTILTLLLTLICPASAAGQDIEIPSSFNPVGSGARAIGMGGAFIAVADDATAASWNPGGLIQLTIPEFSAVGTCFHRGEDIAFMTNPEGAGSHSISEKNINYLSAVYPFGLFRRNMVFALTYQHLYDFTREWQFTLRQDTELLSSENHWNYQQEGRLSALGLSYCVQIIPGLSVGLTLNFWDDDLTDNHWKQKSRMRGSGMLASPFGSMSFSQETDEIRSYSLSGVNANLGFLWRVSHRLTVGGVLKTPFRADVRLQLQESRSVSSEPPEIWNDTRDEELEMPMSCGLGISYRFSDHFCMSADIYRTEWNDFVYRDENGNETCPISNVPVSQSDVDPTHQMRIGAEYRFMNLGKGRVIPVRAGLFYDPAPAEGSPDDFYGLSFGLGLTLNDRFSLDIAYQYRFGNDVGGSMLRDRGFSADVDEHMVYLSMIVYCF